MNETLERLPAVLRKPLRAILGFIRVFVALSGLLMALTFLFVVIVRYGFEGNLFAYEEWLLTISMWGFFLGAVLASERRLHVNADILGVVITNPTLRWWRELVVYVIELLVGIYIVYWCYLAVQSEIDAYPLWETTTALRIPSIIPRIGITFGFAMMVLFSALYLTFHIIDGPRKAVQETEGAQ